MLLNKDTGESVLRNGADEEYRLIFTEDAIMAVEQALGLGVMELLERMTTGRIGLYQVQALVWASVNAQRARSGSSKTITTDRAMRIIKGCGGIVGVLPVLVESIIACSALGLDVDGDDDETPKEGASEADPTVAESDATGPR